MHNLPGPKVAIARGRGRDRRRGPESAGSIGFDDVSLPFPEEVDSGSFDELVPNFAETPLGEGVSATIERFRALLSEGLVAAPVP